jgi:hypothetical protein
MNGFMQEARDVQASFEKLKLEIPPPAPARTESYDYSDPPPIETVMMGKQEYAEIDPEVRGLKSLPGHLNSILGPPMDLTGGLQPMEA